MPSIAYGNFNRNIKQVDKLLEIYEEKKSPNRGRKYLDHFTRAALIFLCSTWEVYIEQIAQEVAKIMTCKFESPDELPKEVRKTLSRVVKNSSHELEPIKIAKDWKNYYLKEVEIRTSQINTPKKQIILELFHKYLGFGGDVVHSHVPKLDEINEIVGARGAIAHNVFAEEYLSSNLVKEYYDTIVGTVKEIEIMFWDVLPEITDNKRPWQNTYKNQ